MDTKFKVGDIVSVEMHYSITEGYYREDGRFDVRKVGEEIKFVSDRIKDFYPGNRVIVRNCGIVPIEHVHAASENDVITVEREEMLIGQMYNQGKKLMAALVEPEYI